MLPPAGARRRLRRRRGGPHPRRRWRQLAGTGRRRRPMPRLARRRPGRIRGSDGSGVRGPPPSLPCRPDGSTAAYLASPGAEPALARRRHHRPLFPRSCQFRRPRPPCIRVCAGGDARPPSHPCPRPLLRDTQLSAVGGGGVGGRSASQWPCYCRRTGSGLPAIAFASSAASPPAANPHEVLFGNRSSPRRRAQSLARATRLHNSEPA